MSDIVQNDQLTGDEIRLARLRIRESQTKLAARCGVSRGTVAKWESEKPPRSGTAHRMALDRVLAELEQVP